MMKFLLSLFATLLLASAVQAKCANGGLQFWPVSKTIKQNPVFVIDGYATSQRIITGLGSTHKAHLRAGTQQIPLIVQEILAGQFALTQAVLKPQRLLTAGQTYELVIEDTQNKGYNLAKTLWGKGATYTAVAGTDKAAPTWKVWPKEKAKHYTEFGCGPEVFVEFSGAAQDQSNYLVKATVKDLVTGKATSCYVSPGTLNTFNIGHDMCAGAFALEKGKNFSVVFALMDASGNTTKWTGKAIAFTAPVLAG